MCLPKLSSTWRLPSLILVVCVAASSSAQITPASGGYLMRVKYTSGTKLEYTTTTTMTSVKPAKGQKPLLVVAPLRLVVGKVTGTKAAVKATLGPMTMSGTQIQAAQDVDLTVDTRNQASEQGANQLMGTQLPLKPVKIGQTWTTKAPVPSGMGLGDSVRSTYRFQGMQTIGGKSMAVIDYTLTEGANGAGTLLILAKDGSLWSNKARLVLNAGTGPMTVVSEMVRR